MMQVNFQYKNATAGKLNGLSGRGSVGNAACSLNNGQHFSGHT
jgi:hypothetical protein